MSYWKDKGVVVTGGSAGLGKSLATAYARAGARVLVAGRDPHRLSQAVAAWRESGLEIHAHRADVTIAAEAEQLIDEATRRFGRLDALVNNVGRSARGRLLDVTPADLRDLWECNVLSVANCTRAAAPRLRETGGHVVNIGSLAAKSAARFLGGYAVAKFAVAAYSQQLRLELAEDGVHVLLVCPGPIARPDAGSRYDAAAADLPESARRPGGGVKVKGIDPDQLAARVLTACERRRPELVIPASARWLFAIQQLWPSLGDWILRKKTS